MHIDVNHFLIKSLKIFLITLGGFTQITVISPSLNAVAILLYAMRKDKGELTF